MAAVFAHMLVLLQGTRGQMMGIDTVLNAAYREAGRVLDGVEGASSKDGKRTNSHDTIRLVHTIFT